MKKEKAIEGLYVLGNRIVRITGSAIFIVLTFFSFLYTQYMLPGGAEVPVNMPDSIGGNIVALALAAGIFMLLLFWEKRIPDRWRQILGRVSVIVAMLATAAVGFWWIGSSAHLPSGDPAFIYGGASYFLEGSYSFLDVGGYCAMYPYQLGLTALCELLFRVVGAYNYRAFEMICLAFAVGSVYLGSRILSEMTRSMAAVAGYSILMIGCLPLVLYTPWVYGDVPSIFFALLAEWALLRYFKNKKKRYLAILISALVLAVLVRNNSLILLVAACLTALPYALLCKDRRILFALLLAALCSYGSYKAVYKMYEARSGYEHSDGIPFIAGVAMGMMDSGNGAAGWDNNYQKEVFCVRANYDTEVAAELAGQDLRERLQIFAGDWKYTVSFFGRKILSQWNEPLYQALFFNAESPEKENGPEPGSLAARLYDECYFKVLAVCDRWQFLVYAGMLCYFLLAVKKDSPILQHTLAVTMIGGFFFSMLYEAKARYIFPYYVMMFPYAAYGYQLAVGKMKDLIERKWRSRKTA